MAWRYFWNSRKCFLDILKDGSDGDIQLKTILKVKHDYLLKIKNAKNKYFKVLLVGDSVFVIFEDLNFVELTLNILTRIFY